MSGNSQNSDAADAYLHASTGRAAVETSGEQQVPFGKRIGILDGVRGIAILMVVIFHTVTVHMNTLSTNSFGLLLANASGLLWCGVDLFFVLSGFLITGILLDSREMPGYFRNFYARRTLRIFPLYYAILVGVIVILPAIWSRLPTSVSGGKESLEKILEHQIYLWLYLQNYLQATGRSMLPGFGHFWSLAVEEQFYIVWPLFVFFLPRRYFLRSCIFFVLIVPLARVLLYGNGVDAWAIRQWTFTRVDSLIAGGLASVIYRTPLLVDRFRPWLLSTMSASGVVLLTAAGFGHVSAGSGFMCTIGYSVFALLFATWLLQLLSLTASSPIPFSHRILNMPALIFLGKYSYGLYVFHWPITHGVRALVRKLTSAGVLDSTPMLKEISLAFVEFALVLSFSLALSIVSWHLWEKHWLRLKTFFSYRVTTPVKGGQAEG